MYMPQRLLTLAVILLVGAILLQPGQAAAADNFTIVVMPDTQNYASGDGGGTADIFRAQTQWIVDNRDALNIIYVAHVGDCVNHADREEEWQNADAAFLKLEGLRPIPYGIAVGNHDKYIHRVRDQNHEVEYVPGAALGEKERPRMVVVDEVGGQENCLNLPVFIDGVHIETTQLYNRYFGTHRFQGKPWFGENFCGNNDNFYHLISAGGLDFILVYFEYATGADVLGWADLILKKYRDRRAIVVTHSLLNEDGSFTLQGRAIHATLKHHPNLFLMLCGHRLAEAQRTDTYQGSPVYTLLGNYQHREKGGNGWLRIMTFSPSQNQIQVKTYSPTLDQFETDADSQFHLDYPMSPD